MEYVGAVKQIFASIVLPTRYCKIDYLNTGKRHKICSQRNQNKLALTEGSKVTVKVRFIPLYTTSSDVHILYFLFDLILN